jgi:hypothetical protein
LEAGLRGVQAGPYRYEKPRFPQVFHNLRRPFSA